MNDRPTFPAWKRENLDQFAYEAFDSMISLQEELQQLRMKLSDQRAGYLARIKVLTDDRDRLMALSRNR